MLNSFKKEVAANMMRVGLLQIKKKKIQEIKNVIS